MTPTPSTVRRATASPSAAAATAAPRKGPSGCRSTDPVRPHTPPSTPTAAAAAKVTAGAVRWGPPAGSRAHGPSAWPRRARAPGAGAQRSASTPAMRPLAPTQPRPSAAAGPMRSRGPTPAAPGAPDHARRCQCRRRRHRGSQRRESQRLRPGTEPPARRPPPPAPERRLTVARAGATGGAALAEAQVTHGGGIEPLLGGSTDGPRAFSRVDADPSASAVQGALDRAPAVAEALAAAGVGIVSIASVGTVAAADAHGNTDGAPGLDGSTQYRFTLAGAERVVLGFVGFDGRDGGEPLDFSFSVESVGRSLLTHSFHVAERGRCLLPGPSAGPGTVQRSGGPDGPLHVSSAPGTRRSDSTTCSPPAS
ncbi:MAG: hypothetical protein MZW92_24170 [Comamonadaceae bacterium]|nr:hypothetical protein [Comamonadaceae bacterium]